MEMRDKSRDKSRAIHMKPIRCKKASEWAVRLLGTAGQNLSKNVSNNSFSFVTLLFYYCNCN